jgi:hypothetical protein
MPGQWTDPELFLEYEGTAIYHCYDDDNMVSLYWYTTDASDCNIDSPMTESAQFDVRDLPNLGLDSDDRQNHPAIIRSAIQNGLISEAGAIEEAADADLDRKAEPRMPDLATLMEWEAEGGCEATDGCWVEPDGVCPHGQPSWLLALGLI